MSKYKKIYAVGIVLVAPNGELVMQLRDNKPGLRFSGMISTFGGECEPGETPRETASRELEEETGIKVKPEKFIEFTVLERRSDELQADVTAYFFILYNINPHVIKVMEGQGYIMINKDDDLDCLNLTEFTQCVAKEYFSRIEG